MCNYMYNPKQNNKSIGDKIDAIEKVVFNHRGIISELKHGLSEFANTLHKVYSRNLPSSNALTPSSSNKGINIFSCTFV